MTSIEEALRSGAVLAEDELVRRGDVLRVLRRLGGQDADLALYGAEDNARAREYGEAAMTRACCAVAIMPTSPDHTPALVALIEERDRLKVELEAAVSVAEMNATAGAFWAERGKQAEARALAAEAELAALRDRQDHARFVGMMTGPDPAAVWKAQAVKLAYDLDTAEAKCDALREALADEMAHCATLVEDEMPATQDMTSTFICEALARAAEAIRERARALTQETSNGE